MKPGTFYGNKENKEEGLVQRLIIYKPQFFHPDLRSKSINMKINCADELTNKQIKVAELLTRMRPIMFVRLPEYIGMRLWPLLIIKPSVCLR